MTWPWRKKKSLPLRRGLVEFRASVTGRYDLMRGIKPNLTQATAEIEELERVQGMSRIRVVGCSGSTFLTAEDARRLLGNWVPTADVHWLEPEVDTLAELGYRP